MEQFVKQLVESGMYPSENEVLRQGVRLMQEQYEVYKFRLAELRKEIAIGLEQADNGQLLESDEVFKRLRAKIEETTARKP
jgi:antitoxin ParD1/3/4